MYLCIFCEKEDNSSELCDKNSIKFVELFFPHKKTGVVYYVELQYVEAYSYTIYT
jgi:hypothetical protein